MQRRRDMRDMGDGVMGDDLRAALPRSFERLADDLLIGRHADPHVAFAVLVYPDRAPAIIAVTSRQSGAHDLSTLEAGKSGEDRHDGGKGRFFVMADLEDARHALDDACLALRMHGRREDKDLGMFIYDQIASGWERRRDSEMRRQMDAAAEEARRPATCEVCGNRYTERGIKAHQTMARYCARVLGERAAAAATDEQVTP